MGRTVEKEVVIRATPGRVFRALTTKEDLERWFVTEAEVDPRPGGSLKFVWETNAIEGKFVEVSPHRIVYILDEGSGYGTTTVTITLTAEGEGTRLHLLHTGFGEGAHWDQLYRGLDSGWNAELGNLRAWLDDGRAKIWPERK
jgi:uncharacterized protein YndB with AHSA1/START domain